MKKLILITLFFVFFSNLNKGICQTYQEGNTYKNKRFDKLVGDWVYKSGDTIFRISLQKTMISWNKSMPEYTHADKFPDLFLEYIIGCYELTVKDKALVSTMHYKSSGFDYENQANPIKSYNPDYEKGVIIEVQNRKEQYSFLVVLTQLTDQTIYWKIFVKPQKSRGAYDHKLSVDKNSKEELVIKSPFPDNIILTKEN